MTEILTIFANKIDNPADIFIYLFIVLQFVVIFFLIRLLLRVVTQGARSIELLNILVYRNSAEGNHGDP